MGVKPIFTKEKRKGMRRKKRLNPLIIILMSGLIVYFVVIFVQQQEEIAVIRSETRALEHKIAQEKETQEELFEQKSKVDTDEFIEMLAREKLGMVKEGERLYTDSE